MLLIPLQIGDKLDPWVREKDWFSRKNNNYWFIWGCRFIEFGKEVGGAGAQKVLE